MLESEGVVTEKESEGERMTVFWLKIIAILSMLVDHVGYVFFPEQMGWRVIGRLAFPIFAFLIAEGFQKSSNCNKYLVRLFLFALISEIPFDWAFNGEPVVWTHQNVLFTFSLAIIGLLVYQRLQSKIGESAWLVAGLIALLGDIGHTDYGFIGIVMVYAFYFFRQSFTKQAVAVIVLNLFFCINSGLLSHISIYTTIQLVANFSLVPIYFYNQQKGPSLKYFFYLFYPGHLALLAFITQSELWH